MGINIILQLGILEYSLFFFEKWGDLTNHVGLVGFNFQAALGHQLFVSGALPGETFVDVCRTGTSKW